MSSSAMVIPRPFDFERDSFAFANDLLWEYRFDQATGKTSFVQRKPKPAYAHRCFVLTRATRQFLYHARFDETLPRAGEETYRRLIRDTMSRSPRTPCQPGDEILFPGYASLRHFSAACESLLKTHCGRAWQSYVLRSHWRMVFPISRRHQAATAGRLTQSIRQNRSPIVHLVRFPSLSINHGMVLFGMVEGEHRICYHAYDPNDPEKPTEILFDRAQRNFSLPANRYWAGGPLNVIEIYRNWLL